MINVINPASGELIKTYEEYSTETVNDLIATAHSAFHQWKRTSFAERMKLLRNVGRLLLENKDSYACLMAEEMGKPVADGRAEIEKCSWVCNYYAENAKQQLQPEIIETDGSQSYVSFQPIGAILAVMPWNFPFWQVFRFAPPNLMAGNVGLLKHASNVPGSALAIEKLFIEAGYPKGCFTTLLVGASKIDHIIDDPVIKYLKKITIPVLQHRNGLRDAVKVQSKKVHFKPQAFRTPVYPNNRPP
jgi:succinate-semialdehyde dehydrogenase/glutarate-semialdehyde dehydrogenase